MRYVTRRITAPWCICVKSRNEGWSRDPETDKWVHPGCGKPSKACA